MREAEGDALLFQRRWRSIVPILTFPRNGKVLGGELECEIAPDAS